MSWILTLVFGWASWNDLLVVLSLFNCISSLWIFVLHSRKFPWFKISTCLLYIFKYLLIIYFLISSGLSCSFIVYIASYSYFLGIVSSHFPYAITHRYFLSEDFCFLHHLCFLVFRGFFCLVLFWILGKRIFPNTWLPWLFIGL